MYPNLSRDNDSQRLDRYPGSSVRGFNLDRIRSVIERGGEDDADQDKLVESIQQVVDYEPDLTSDVSVGNHFVDYCMMQDTSAPVLSKILELFTVEEYALTKAARDAPNQTLRGVLDQFMEQDKCDGCNSRQATELLSCARCKQARYCGRNCQKQAWKATHKLVCVSHDIPRLTVEEKTIDAIQRAVDEAEAGEVVVLSEGIYEAGQKSRILLNKPIYLFGEGDVLIEGNVVIAPSTAASTQGDSASKSLALALCKLNGTVEASNVPFDMTFHKLDVRCRPQQNSNDCVVFTQCSGSVLLDSCQIVGGMDDVRICSRKVHIRRSEILQAQGDKNDIQPGPWNSFGGGGGFF